MRLRIAPFNRTERGGALLERDIRSPSVVASRRLSGWPGISLKCLRHFDAPFSGNSIGREGKRVGTPRFAFEPGSGSDPIVRLNF